MDKLSSFLQKFAHLLSNKEYIQTTVIDIVREEIGIDIAKENISLRNNQLTFNISPTIKTQIFIKKSLLLEKINNKIGKKTIQDLQ